MFLLLCFVFGLTSCNPIVNPENNSTDTPVALSDDSKLIGAWESSYGEIYTIAKTSLSNGGSWGDCYAGDNLVVLAETETSGIIFIKYTRAMTADYKYSTDASVAPDVGKWYALAYKNLTDTSLSISGAYKADGKSSEDSLENAVKEFTVDNGYFGTYSECVKK